MCAGHILYIMMPDDYVFLNFTFFTFKLILTKEIYFIA